MSIRGTVVHPDWFLVSLAGVILASRTIANQTTNICVCWPLRSRRMFRTFASMAISDWSQGALCTEFS